MGGGRAGVRGGMTQLDDVCRAERWRMAWRAVEGALEEVDVGRVLRDAQGPTGLLTCGGLVRGSAWRDGSPLVAQPIVATSLGRRPRHFGPLWATPVVSFRIKPSSGHQSMPGKCFQHCSGLSSCSSGWSRNCWGEPTDRLLSLRPKPLSRTWLPGAGTYRAG